MHAPPDRANPPPADPAICSTPALWSFHRGKYATLIWALLALFLLLGLVRIHHHVMYGDEMQAWLLVQANPSPAAILHQLHYEGHPALWFFILDAVNLLGGGPFAAQALHVLIATMTIAVVAFFSPFTRWQKVLFALGYFPFYEYAVITRNYAIGILLGFVACAILCRRPVRLFLVACLILLMSQGDLLSLMLAMGLAAAAVVAEITAENNRPARRRPASLALFLAAMAGIVALFFLEVRPAADAGYTSDWQTHYQRSVALHVLGYVWRAYVPVPRAGWQFWNTNFIDPHMRLGGELGVAMMLFGLALTWRRPAALAMYIVSTGLILLFSYVKYPATSMMRHQGHLFVALATAYWLSRSTGPWPASIASRAAFRLSRCLPSQRLLTAAVTILFGIQALAGVYASVLDYRYPFSQARAAADYIAAHFSPDTPVVADEDYACESVAGYLHRPIFYAAGARWGTYVHYDKLRNIDQSRRKANLLQQARAMIDRRKSDVLILANYVLPPRDGITQIWSSGLAIESTESYHLYLAQFPKYSIGQFH